MRSAESKLASLEEIAARLEGERAAGRKIALATGPFQLVHIGGVRFLSALKAEADVLVVAVIQDEYTKPVVPPEDRALVLAALRAVDHVLVVRPSQLDDVRGLVRADVSRFETEDGTRALINQIRR